MDIIALIIALYGRCFRGADACTDTGETQWRHRWSRFHRRGQFISAFFYKESYYVFVRKNGHAALIFNDLLNRSTASWRVGPRKGPGQDRRRLTPSCRTLMMAMGEDRSLYSYSRDTGKSHSNCTQIALKSHSNRTRIDLKLHSNCPQITCSRRLYSPSNWIHAHRIHVHSHVENGNIFLV